PSSDPAEKPFNLVQTLSGPGVIAATTPSGQATPLPVRPSPIPLPARRPTPVPAPETPAHMIARPSPLPRTLTPVPGIPGAAAIVAYQPPQLPDAVPSIAPFATGGGTLVSNRAPDDEAAVAYGSPASDITERVRVPTPIPMRDDTAFIRPPRSRLPLIIGLAVAVAAAGIAIIVIGSGGNSKPEAAAVNASEEPAHKASVADEVAPGKVTDDDMKPEPVAVDREPAKSESATAKTEPEIQTEPAPVKTEPVAKPVAKLAPVAKPPAPEIAKPVPKKPLKPPAVAKAPPVKKPPPVKTTPLVKTPPKVPPKPEPAWNAESPFMPVRTEKDNK
ncbi:MAG: hypothetical protein ABI175_05025, partial [Polyangiales bacterium]